MQFDCYLSKFNIQPHYHKLIVYIHEVKWVFQLRLVFQTLVILVNKIVESRSMRTKQYGFHGNEARRAFPNKAHQI